MSKLGSKTVTISEVTKLEIYFSFYIIVVFYFTHYEGIGNIFPKHDPPFYFTPQYPIKNFWEIL
jgi:hypothetical protein